MHVLCVVCCVLVVRVFVFVMRYAVLVAVVVSMGAVSFPWFLLREKTPCVESKRSRVCRQNVRVSHDTLAFQRHTLELAERTHGHVLNVLSLSLSVCLSLFISISCVPHVKMCCKNTGSGGVVCAVLFCAAACRVVSVVAPHAAHPRG